MNIKHYILIFCACTFLACAKYTRETHFIVDNQLDENVIADYSCGGIYLNGNPSYVNVQETIPMRSKKRLLTPELYTSDSNNFSFGPPLPCETFASFCIYRLNGDTLLKSIHTAVGDGGLGIFRLKTIVEKQNMWHEHLINNWIVTVQ